MSAPPPLHLSLVCLAALLSACGSTASMPEVTLQGDIVIPPAAGTATFSAFTGSGQTDTVGTATVTADGRYTLKLGTPAGTGTVKVLPALPDAAAQGMNAVNCTGDLHPSSEAGRYALLNKGQYLVGGQVTGELLPSVTAIAGLGAQELVVTTKYLAFASQDVQIQGELNCLFTRPNGEKVVGTVSVHYDLTRGWNTLMIRTASVGQGVLETVAQSQPLTGVQWRYFPVGQ